MRIVPAILSHTTEDLKAKITAVEAHFTEAHIDFMDGIFVPNKTVRPADLKEISTSLKLEGHLMMEEPISAINELAKAHFKKIIIHLEIGQLATEAIHLIRGMGIKAGLAVNPDSNLEAARHLFSEIDSVMLMGVNPGHYGSAFQPMVLEKLRELRNHRFPGEIEVDGGVTPETAPLLHRAGAATLVSGHFLFGSEEDPSLDKIGEKLDLLRAALANSQ